MVDFKLLLNPPVCEKPCLIQRRCHNNGGSITRIEKVINNVNNNSSSKYLLRQFYDQPQFKRRYYLAVIISFILIVFVSIGLAYHFGAFDDTKDTLPLIPANPMRPLPPSASTLHTFQRAAVCVDAAASR